MALQSVMPKWYRSIYLGRFDTNLCHFQRMLKVSKNCFFQRTKFFVKENIESFKNSEILFFQLGIFKIK
jgi:hypothetical protein